jgi:hypothetical protein
MENEKIQFVKSNLYNDDSFELVSINAGDDTLKKGRCKSEAVCILPFDLSEQNKIKDLYLLKQEDFFNKNVIRTCLTEDINDSIDDDSFDTFKRCIHKDLAIKNFNNIDSCYYLGKISHTDPIVKDYYCYGICLNDYIKGPNGFTPDLPTEEVNGKYYTLDKIRFSKAIKGEVNDSLVLSSCMLLISYIS